MLDPLIVLLITVEMVVLEVQGVLVTKTGFLAVRHLSVIT